MDLYTFLSCLNMHLNKTFCIYVISALLHMILMLHGTRIHLLGRVHSTQWLKICVVRHTLQVKPTAAYVQQPYLRKLTLRVQKVTVHSSLEAFHSYKRISVSQHQEVGKILVTNVQSIS